MARGDFNYISVHHQFTANAPVWEKNFRIDIERNHVSHGTDYSMQDGLCDDAYMLIMVQCVDSQKHRIQINSKDLSGIDIPGLSKGARVVNSRAWLTYIVHIPSGILQPGSNNIQITRVGNDDFYVSSIVVHWREVTFDP